MTLDVVLLVLGILAVQVLIWVPLIRVLRRRALAKHEEIRADIERNGEKLAFGPQAGLYRGSDAPPLPRAKGNAVIALTDQRLIVHRLVGEPIEVPRERIIGAREDVWFLGSMTSMQKHLILKLEGGGELGLILEDHGTWLAHLTKTSSRGDDAPATAS